MGMEMLDLIEKHFSTRDLYAVIKTSAKDASDPKKLRSAYLKAALVFHPDKAEDKDKENATEKFQLIAKIHEVLRDDDLRSVYDETGEWPDDDQYNLPEGSLAKLDVHLIEEFKKYYLGSDEEREDVKKMYIKYKGNILDVIEHVFFAEILSDEDRIQGIVTDLIDKKEMKAIQPKGDLAADRKKRIKRATKEAAEAEEELGRMGLKPGGGFADLSAAIMARRAPASNSFLDNLEKKYADLEKQPRSKRSRREK